MEREDVGSCWLACVGFGWFGFDILVWLGFGFGCFGSWFFLVLVCFGLFVLVDSMTLIVGVELSKGMEF